MNVSTRLYLTIICIFVCFDVGHFNTTSCDADNDLVQERALIMLKPDGVQRNLVGRVISRFEEKGFKLVALKMGMAEREVLEKHYEEHAGKKFFESLMDYMLSGPVVPMVWEGNNVVKIARTMLGATDPLESAPGTIRGDFGLSKQKNILHVSDSVESANREIELWFKPSELVQWREAMQHWKI
eukprot:TRINITY_DN5328_c0_g1_i2.p1 TRINITY_DN5328_c0_g1~~TRINITY_DN5328_c0_g1_i2.p1  ORF type:complete len:184 (+),score=22.44 TRINITY_DN5328_c0_g1_i2:790-1341(+)